MEIMIVDDEPQVAEVLARSLIRQGHRTTVVHSGQEALDRLHSVPLDAMFLDVSMPGMNGLDVMAEVKRLKPTLAVVVPAKLAAEDRCHAWRDRCSAVRQLLGQPHSAGEDVIDREGVLMAGRPRDLGLKVVDLGPELRQQMLLGAERRNLRGVAAMTTDETVGDRTGQPMLRRDRCGDSVELGRFGGPDQR